MDNITPATLAIIVVTGIISWLGFRDPYLVGKYIFHPQSILGRKEYYRMVSSGFLHGDWQHLIFNMLSLYFFGPGIEAAIGIPKFLLIYFGSIIGGHLLSLWIHRHQDYRALGASGGVCGIIYASIFLFPGGSIMLFLIPIPIPTWAYAILFLLFSFYGMKAQRDNIGHDAHLGGAICGLLITTALYPEKVKQSLGLFLAVLLLSLVLLGYLLINPLFLPLGTVWAEFQRKRRASRKPW